MKYKDMFDEAKENAKTKQLTAEYFEFDEKGRGFIGCLMGIQAVTSKLGGDPYNQYLWDTDQGLIKCAFGRATDGEAGALMKIGGVYSVTFLGSEPLTGGRKVNRFDIWSIMTDEEVMVGGEEDKAFEEEPAPLTAEEKAEQDKEAEKEAKASEKGKGKGKK